MDGGNAVGPVLHRFTVDEYYRMAEAGVLPNAARTELIRGMIVDMATIGTPHMRTVNRLNRLLVQLAGDRATVSVQNPVRLDRFSEPQPDVALLAPEHDADLVNHPRPDDVFLVIEVSDTTLAADRAKASLYAESRLGEYWIVDVNAPVITVHRDPQGGAYRTVFDVGAGPIEVMVLPGVAISAEDVLPRH